MCENSNLVTDFKKVKSKIESCTNFKDLNEAFEFIKEFEKVYGYNSNLQYFYEKKYMELSANINKNY